MPVRTFDDYTEDEIIQKYQSGTEVPKLAEEYGVPVTSIRSVLKRDSVPRRGPSQVSRRYKDIPGGRIEIDVKRAYSLYQEGYSTPRIGRMLGVGAYIVQRRLKEAGYELKKNSNFRCNHAFFSAYTAESCYWAGFLAADGCVNKKKPTIVLALQEADRATVEHMKACVEAEHPVRTHKKDRTESFVCILAITSQQWKDDLAKNFSIVPAKSYTLKPPSERMPKNMQGHFIRGVLDGDGSVDARGNHGYFAIVGAAKPFITWISRVFQGGRWYKCREEPNLLYRAWSSIRHNFDFVYGGSTETTRMARKYDQAKAVMDAREASEWSGEGRKKLSPQDEAVILERYAAGETQKRIALDYPVNRATVGNILIRHEVSKRKKGPTIKLAGECLIRARELRGQGWSYRKISKEIGLAHTTIRAALVKEEAEVLPPAP